MSAPALTPPPTSRTILVEQVRAAGVQLRGVGIFFGGLLVLLAALAIRVAYISRATHAANPKLGAVNLAYAPQTSVILAFVALLLPLILWQDEDPSRRHYHWAMPVSRPRHALIKTFAGWVWLISATVTFLAFWAVITILVERITRMPQRHDAGFEWWEWLITPVAVTIAYLLASSAAVGARRPMVWIFGLPVLYGGIAALLLTFGMVGAARGMSTLYSGFLGAEAALAGSIDFVNGGSGFPLPSLARWLGASLLWGGAGLILLVTVARWRREPSV